MVPMVTCWKIVKWSTGLVIWCKDVQGRSHPGMAGWVAGWGEIRFVNGQISSGKVWADQPAKLGFVGVQCDIHVWEVWLEQLRHQIGLTSWPLRGVNLRNDCNLLNIVYVYQLVICLFLYRKEGNISIFLGGTTYFSETFWWTSD